MDEITLASESLQLVRKDLGLEEDMSLEGLDDPFERLQQFLEKRVRYMLDCDFPGLLNALYRIDIAEQKVKTLIELSPPDELAQKITEAIIEREKQKVITRRKYRQT